MPRIQAPTVAEHRARQRQTLLDAARALLLEMGEPPSMGQVGNRAGLARSSVYQYFPSVEELLTAVAADVFPTWVAGIHHRVAAAPTPGTRVWAYIEANFALFASPELAVAQVLSRVIAPQALHSSMSEFHLQLQVPLRQALSDLHEPEPERMADMIDSLIVQATHDIDHLEARQLADAHARSLACLRRLLSGYLQLPPEDS